MKHEKNDGVLGSDQAPDSSVRPCRVSIIIKSLNEEKRIAATLEGALRAIAVFGGEVILADSYSSDQTIDIARRYPVRIVQLKHPQERCCGIGPQLGYQYARGEFLYLVDGDMQLIDGFLEQALAFMHDHPDIAGVGGRVLEMNLSSPEYQVRHDLWAQSKSGQASRLDGGGLYRRSAIEAAGYFSDRNLHSYEEFDLAARLRSLGWSLWRMPVHAVSHYGHETPPYQLLLKRWRSRYLCGLGELLRASARETRLGLVLREVRELRLYAAVLLWWATLLTIPLWPVSVGVALAAGTVLLIAPLGLMTWRKRSFQSGLYSVISWCFNTAGLVRGLRHVQIPARRTIDSQMLQDADCTPIPHKAESHRKSKPTPSAVTCMSPP